MTRTRATAEPSIYRTTTSAGTPIWVAQKRWTEDGRRRSLKGQGATAAEALQRLQKRESLPEDTRTVRARQKPRESVRAGSTVEGYARVWSQARKVSETVRYKDLRTLENHVFPLIGTKVLRTLTGEDLQRMMTSLEDEGLGPGGRRNVFKALSVMFTFAEKRGKIKSNPIRRLERPELKRHRQQTVMERRMELVKEMVADYGGGMTTRDYARIRIGLLGLRPSEALGLTWEDVEVGLDVDDIVTEAMGGKRAEQQVRAIIVRRQLARHEVTESERGYYLKPRTKTDEVRRVPVDAATSRALMEWKRDQEWDRLRRPKTSHERAHWMDSLVFTRDDGKFINQNDDQERWKEILKDWQVEHDEILLFPIGYLRKISVTIMRDEGVPDSVVSAMMGHTTTVEDQHYYAPQLNAQAEAVKKLAGALQ